MIQLHRRRNKEEFIQFIAEPHLEFVDVSSLEETVDRLSKDDWFRGLFVAIDDKCDVCISRRLSRQRQHFPFLAYITKINKDLLTTNLTDHVPVSQLFSVHSVSHPSTHPPSHPISSIDSIQPQMC